MAAVSAPSIGDKTSPSKSKYRPEIDGLRAFAVVAVIINHFNKDLLPSGYLGVDIFFVISGYVITSSLAGRESKNLLDFLTGFYERRIKRLVPALVVFVLITSVLISLFNPDPGSVLGLGWKSLFGISNISLYRSSTDYFAQSTELNPFTHTWSLGVEEQFYLLFPFLIWFSGFGQQKVRGARNLFFWVGALTIASLISFIYLYQVNQPAAYFLMAPRFWEMAAGCLIFIGFQKREKIEQALEQAPPLLVVAAMVGVMFLPTEAAVPATISIVVLSAILVACLKKGTAAYDFFTLEKVVYVGLISYSLYLWHWSVLSISRWTIGIHWWSVPIQAGLMLLLAIGSYRWIETPIRHSSRTQSKRWSIGGGASIVILVATAIFTLAKSENPLFLGKREKSEPLKSRLSSKLCENGNQLIDDQLLSKCSLGSRSSASIISIGDSQTAHLVPMLNLLNERLGLGVMYYSMGGINFPSLIEERSVGDSASDFQEKYQRTLKVFDYYTNRSKPNDILLLSSRYELRWGNHPIPQSQRQLKFSYYDDKGSKIAAEDALGKWENAFNVLIERALSKGLRVVIFNPIPTFQYPLSPSPQRFNKLSYARSSQQYFTRGELINHYQKVSEVLKSLQARHSNVFVFDAFGVLCPPPDSRQCLPDAYRDQWHLSAKGAENMYPAFSSFLLKKFPSTRKL
jgi:peptidoglycan/LPS O-acetylase OafA/YrhL